jgi:hypothetical protein
VPTSAKGAVKKTISREMSCEYHLIHPRASIETNETIPTTVPSLVMSFTTLIGARRAERKAPPLADFFADGQEVEQGQQ